MCGQGLLSPAHWSLEEQAQAPEGEWEGHQPVPAKARPSIPPSPAAPRRAQLSGFQGLRDDNWPSFCAHLGPGSLQPPQLCRTTAAPQSPSLSPLLLCIHPPAPLPRDSGARPRRTASAPHPLLRGRGRRQSPRSTYLRLPACPSQAAARLGQPAAAPRQELLLSWRCEPSGKAVLKQPRRLGCLRRCVPPTDPLAGGMPLRKTSSLLQPSLCPPLAHLAVTHHMHGAGGDRLWHLFRDHQRHIPSAVKRGRPQHTRARARGTTRSHPLAGYVLKEGWNSQSELPSWIFENVSCWLGNPCFPTQGKQQAKSAGPTRSFPQLPWKKL